MPADIDNKESIYDLKTINIENWSAGQKAAAKNLMDTIISQTGSTFIEKNSKTFACAKLDTEDHESIRTLAVYAAEYIEKRIVAEGNDPLTQGTGECIRTKVL